MRKAEGRGGEEEVAGVQRYSIFIHLVIQLYSLSILRARSKAGSVLNAGHSRMTPV